MGLAVYQVAFVRHTELAGPTHTTSYYFVRTYVPRLSPVWDRHGRRAMHVRVYAHSKDSQPPSFEVAHFATCVRLFRSQTRTQRRKEEKNPLPKTYVIAPAGPRLNQSQGSRSLLPRCQVPLREIRQGTRVEPDPSPEPTGEPDPAMAAPRGPQMGQGGLLKPSLPGSSAAARHAKW